MAVMTTWPLKNNIIRGGLNNHTFGMVRRDPTGAPKPHQGWDFSAPINTPCYAVADGRVLEVSNFGDYGRRILMRFTYDFDGNGDEDILYAFYAHLNRADVKAGDTVKKGQQIGLTGDSGNAKGLPKNQEHLHFEVRTQLSVGRGLDGRLSPMVIFHKCPLKEAVAQ